MRFFRPESAWFRLTSLDQREALVKAAGADEMLVFTFDAALAGLSAEAFVTERLLGEIGVGGVVTGDDFTFGRSEEHTSELQSLMRTSYAVFCLKKKTQPITTPTTTEQLHYTLFLI